MKLRHGLIVVLCVLLVAPRANAEDRVPGADWQHILGWEAGWSRAGLETVHDRAQQLNSTALMVVHHGIVVAEWGDTVKRTELASVRKSFLSALIGIAVAQHKIDLNATLGQLGIDDNPPSLTETEKRATVRMLLEARSGIYHAALYETAAMAAKRPPRGSHAPDTFWYYNNWDFNALGTIYEHATGMGIYDALNTLIARPIGMQDYRPADGTYFTGAASIHRAYPIRMSARDLARFALLYLHGGNWGGKQIVPEAWVRESTRPYSTTNRGRGYGYLWWTGTGTVPSVSGAGLGLPEGTYFALGAGGQYTFVIPKCDLVIVSRVDRDQHLPEPVVPRMAELVRLILHAGGFLP